MEVVRTWRRDRSQNLMPLDIAAENLHRNASITREEAKRRLMSGETVKTPCAEFVIPGLK